MPSAQDSPLTLRSSVFSVVKTDIVSIQPESQEGKTVSSYQLLTTDSRLLTSYSNESIHLPYESIASAHRHSTSPEFAMS
jgi:hypothetical protein